MKYKRLIFEFCLYWPFKFEVAMRNRTWLWVPAIDTYPKTSGWHYSFDIFCFEFSV